jgi:predicted site-specific integrase-resolvase
MPTVINNRTYYRTSEACQTAGVSRSTFFRWLKMGVLEDVPQKDRRGWRLFTESDIRKIRAEVNRIGAAEW